MILVLPVKRKWFDKIKSGEKLEEYRLDNPYWQKRLIGKEFEKIVVTLGYPKSSNMERRIEFPWNGFTMKDVVSEEWNEISMRVFAIKLGED